MGLERYYDKVSSEEEEPLERHNVPDVPPKSAWRGNSLLISLAVGTILVAILTAVVTALGAAVLKHNDTTPAPVVTPSPSLALATTSAAPPPPPPASTSLPPPPPPPVATSSPAKEVEDAVSKITYCGSSPADARAQGCVFDVMMQDWMPRECYDEALSERFLAKGNWTWWADPQATRAMSMEEMKRGEHRVVYVAQDYHRTHCLFAWEKLVRALRTQSPMVEELISYDHVMHCRMKTLTPADEPSNLRGVVAPVAYTRCAPYEVWIKALPHNEMSSTD